jgi:tripartite-type tricarboxylate transporter receptor subunit TctC
LNQSDLVLAVHPSLPVQSVRDLIELARAQPHALNYASSGPGTPYHMAGELFKSMASVDIVHIPYKGSSSARTDLIGGQVQMMFDAITTMAPQAQAGKVRVLASSGRERSAVMPDVPTLAEACVPGYEATIWLGVMAPAGTPAAIVNKLNAAIRSIVTSAEIKSVWIEQGARPISMSPDDFGRFVRDDIGKWASVIKRADIKPD